MEDDLLSLVKSCKIFSALNEAACKKILPKLHKTIFKKGDILFHQGDAPDCVYILLSGRLSAQLVTEKGETKFLNYIEPGETVGELGVLTDEPRTVTVKTVDDSILFKLSKKDFLEVFHLYPSVMVATIQPVITRSQSLIQLMSPEKRKKHIVIIPARENISLEEFYENLSNAAEKITSLQILSDYNPNISNLDFEDFNKIIDKAEKSDNPIKKFLYIIKSYEGALAEFSLSNADMIYIIAKGNSSPHINHQVLKLTETLKSRYKNAPELILLHGKETVLPNNTAEWLKLAPFALHHHVRINRRSDYKRLLRFIRDKAIGLVFGGGGTRGWAHLGVIKALEEARIPIDMIGGTSVGGIIAGCYAINPTYDHALKKFSELIDLSRHSVSWLSLTWPAISIFNAKNFTLALQTVFDNIHIEDLWIPYFNLSTNLGKNSEAVHRKGLLWQTTRASSAIPGIIPPMVIDSDLHFDGGLLNNLPVDIMRQLIGPKGKIIAVELGGGQFMKRKYYFPPILTFIPAFLSKLRLGYKAYKFPRFLDTFLKAIFAGSTHKTKQNGKEADLLISLDLSKFSMLRASLKQGDKISKAGYHESKKQISQQKLWK